VFGHLHQDSTVGCHIALALLEKATPDLLLHMHLNMLHPALLLAGCTHAFWLCLGAINITRQPATIQNALTLLTCCSRKKDPIASMHGTLELP
jgi:hypothetical protein